MKLARFHTGDGDVRVGRVDGDQVVDLSGVEGVGTSVREILPDLPKLKQAIEAADGTRHPLASVALLAPIDDPQKYLGIGMNYKEHAEEARQAGIPTPTSQLWFNKQVSCINDPLGDIVKPDVSDELDYEIELAVVIGQRCKHVAAENARSVIAGYMVANDVSVRDWLVKRSPTFTLGKSFDTHGPMGPWLVTPDEIGDPHALELRTWVNGEMRQHSNTKQLIFDCFAQVEHLSTAFTLEPGDVITTGTPAGVGGAMKPPRFLVAGDVVRIEIERIGTLENRVVPEPEDSALL